MHGTQLTKIAGRTGKTSHVTKYKLPSSKIQICPDNNDKTVHTIQKTCLYKGFNLMHHHWLVGKLNQRLGTAECQRPQASSISSNQYHSLHVVIIYTTYTHGKVTQHPCGTWCAFSNIISHHHHHHHALPVGDAIHTACHINNPDVICTANHHHH